MKKLTGWNERLIAIKILNRFEKDKKLKEHIEKLTSRLHPQDRAFIREIVSGTVRFLRLLDFSIEKATGKDLKRQKNTVRNSLRVIAYQIFFTNVPPYAALNETVEAVKKILGKKAAGFVNAISKKIIGFDYKKEIERISDYFERLSILYSFETWMVKRWSNFYGKEEIEKLLKGLNRVAPLFIRVNTIKISQQELLNLLEKTKIDAEPHPFIPYMIRIKGRVPIESIPGYKEGFFYIQDPASFLSAYLLDPKPGEIILDVGAAPGGKTTALSSLTMDKARIIAVDINKERMKLLKNNLKRLGISNVEIVLTDIQRDKNFIEKHENSFDKILIDAPCSATGVIRRHPEGKWNKSLKLIKYNQTIQRNLLKSCYKLLKPRGVLLYSICSLEKEEGEDILKFAQEIGFKESSLYNLPKELKPFAEKHFLRVFPHKNNLDGFFYSKLEK
ncbi:16S rRNA (cytosine(967)-C(5))-methyltransferase RsmB [Desulfurobacterium thermolithotrophum]|uniref:16S rRNA (cytosine(967)-C(5))-methyltransferase RsmB n=1 Tax=Desulfurobacterium thermolithotrophum TaxID=64160 RepID=UPI001EF859EC|nr:16S rRNA (cytosine(967)-C(5))-methyltransferase RsmB [Desulfurobacterium thermolithotrophum]